MDFNRPDYEVDGGVCSCWWRTAIIFNLQWKAKNFQREEKIDKQDIKGTENESNSLKNLICPFCPMHTVNTDFLPLGLMQC